MDSFADLCCAQCGSHAIAHFQNAQLQWQNRCQRCGHESEYVPNQAEIAAACEAIRAARPWQTQSDEEERLLRLAEALWETDDELMEEDEAHDLAPRYLVVGS